MNKFLKLCLIVSVAAATVAFAVKRVDFSPAPIIEAPEKKYNKKFKTQKRNPTPPIELSDKEKMMINKIIANRQSQPEELKVELNEYMEKTHKIRDEKRNLYKNLSKEAKDAMNKEKNLKRHLSYKAKQALEKNLNNQ